MNNADKPINSIVQEEYIAGNRILQCTQAGLTKREHFAGLALQGLLSSFTVKSANGMWGEDAKETAMAAVKFADELLKQLEATKAD